MRSARAGWREACHAARLLAVDVGLGVILRGPPGPALDRWLALLRAGLPPATPWRRLPPGTGPQVLTGGLDLAATLAAGRPVEAKGLLASVRGGLLLVPSAERLGAETAARLAAALDDGHEAPLGIIAIDDGREADEGLPSGLADRLAIRLDLGALGGGAEGLAGRNQTAVVSARARLSGIRVADDAIEALCRAALALGIETLRAPILALRLARAAAALAGRDAVAARDVALAARLVLAPRATRRPEVPDDERAPTPSPPRGDTERGEAEDTQRDGTGPTRLAETVVEAARAALPEDLMMAGSQATAAARGGGRRGESFATGLRGRPLPPRRGRPSRERALDPLATLRAAIPWQTIRKRGEGERILIRPDDLRVRRFESVSRATAVVAVDASGSAALHRLAEAKGAVELILAECYLRRDEVALVAFRGEGAEIVLPPTRALARARRELASLPGGGGTPLAAGLDLARGVAAAARRGGRRPVIAVLTDGRANVARDGAPDRARAGADATASARLIREAGVAAVVIDVSPRPGVAAAALAREMGARYLPLPHLGAEAIAGAVLAQAAAPRRS